MVDTTTKLEDHCYAAEIPAGSLPQDCRYCGAQIMWGITNKGRRAPFDLPATPYGYVNHFLTCKHPPVRRKRA